MDLGLADKAVLLVGGSRGIGLAAATMFAGEGTRVAIAARERKALDDDWRPRSRGRAEANRWRSNATAPIPRTSRA